MVSLSAFAADDSMKDFSRVHDVVRVQRLLDGLHHADGACTSLGHQEVHFVQTNAVLASAGAAQAQRSWGISGLIR